jgi:parvulin-like peptidyl-prolyl isomerase
MSKQFCDIAFVEEAGRVYGPIETKDGMHLLYLHSCRGGDDFKEEEADSKS